MKTTLFCSIVFALVFSAFILKEKPTCYIIGDSTVRNGDGTGSNGQWGWGSFVADYFDTSGINVTNLAIGGRSSRTFITEGRWDRILSSLKEGDYVIMQFGHNDAGPLDDTARARGTIRGTGEDSKEIFNPKTGKREVVHTYGWYMRKYIRETKAKGAIPIICSPVPRHDWKEGKLVRSTYSTWAEQVAKEEGAHFINLNELIAVRYEAMGPEAVISLFQGDHTHTNKAGARLNAQIVAEALKGMGISDLNKVLK